MGQIANLLKKLQENSEDLSTLPQLIAQVETLETAEESNQLRIQKLQEVNRSYLAQIPVPGDKTKPNPEDEDKAVTIEDAKQALINALTGGKE
jgi:hypothetical protein